LRFFVAVRFFVALRRFFAAISLKKNPCTRNKNHFFRISSEALIFKHTTFLRLQENCIGSFNYRNIDEQVQYTSTKNCGQLEKVAMFNFQFSNKKMILKNSKSKTDWAKRKKQVTKILGLEPEDSFRVHTIFLL